MTESQEKDYNRYYISGGEPGFSPARNKAIIDSTIKKHEAMRRKRFLAYKETVQERSEAIASYLFSNKGAQGGNSVEKYFGKQILGYLQGQRIVEEMAYMQNKMYKRLKEIR